MDITFNVLHAFHSASNPNGNADVRRILHDCLVRLNHAHSANGIGPAQYQVNGRLVVWNLPHVFGSDCTFDANAWALRCLLDCLIALNTSYLVHGGDVRIPQLYDSGVEYDRTQIWDTIPALYQRGFGDCKSLTAALIAQYMHQGIECAPVFRFQTRRDGSGALDFHILVQTVNGFEDPSKVLGMGSNENAASIRGLRR
jgi:hypothetical protein